MSEETLEIERIDDTRCARLVLRGDLDLYSAPTLDDQLVAVEGEKWPVLFLDCRELDFVDSAGLRLFLRTHARAKQDGRRFVVIRGSENVDRVLALTGLDGEIETVDEPFIPDEV